MKTRTWMLAVLALSAATLVACGGDDENTAPEDAGGTGGDSGDETDAGGMGGNGGGGTGGGAVLTEECGTATCQPPTNPLAGLASMFGGAMGMAALPMAAGCCLDEDTNTCGYAMMAGGTCNEPAVADTRCPDFTLMLPDLGGLMLPPIEAGFGCCIDDMCGVDGSIFGGGCNENGSAREMLMGMPAGAFLLPGLPEPRRCDAPPDTDSGMTDDDAGN